MFSLISVRPFAEADQNLAKCLQNILAGTIIIAPLTCLDCLGSAERGSREEEKAQSELLAALGRAQPEWANSRLGSLVPRQLARRAQIQADLAAAREKLQSTSAAVPDVAPRQPSLVTG